MSVLFENDGLLPLEAVRTLGISAKEGTNPIGFFGTGLKYAIAVLLRTGHKIHMMIGPDMHGFSVRETEVRGQKFNIVQMNGQDLGFTTDLGKNWKVWQAWRELACNAIDEGGIIRSIGPAQVVEPEVGRTRILVVGAEIDQAQSERATILLESNPRHSWPDVELHPERSKAIFYRGVRAAELKETSLYTWNITGHCTLTEDRTLKYEFEWKDRIAMTIVRRAPRELIREVLTALPGSLEATINFDNAFDYNPSTDFIEELEELVANNPARVNQTAYVAHRRRRAGAPEARKEAVLTQRDEDLIADAIAICQDQLNCSDLQRKEIKIAISLGPNVMGLMEGGVIWIARSTLSEGLNRLAGTIYEEWVHSRLGLVDESRSLQNFLFDKVIELASGERGRPVSRTETEPDCPF